jgi:ABC-type multidrug transport system ATPase subunit
VLALRAVLRFSLTLDSRLICCAGKTTFLKALSCQLNKGSGQLDGEILYNGDSVDCGKYLVGKITSYVDERDQHAPTLTVRETLEFAWRSTTAGHHSYNVARDSTSAEVLDRGDAALVKVSPA